MIHHIKLAAEDRSLIAFNLTKSGRLCIGLREESRALSAQEAIRLRDWLNDAIAALEGEG